MSLAQIFFDGTKAKMLFQGEEWDIHEAIYVDESFAGEFCTVLELNERGGYIRRFEFDGVVFHKDMQPFKPKSKGGGNIQKPKPQTRGCNKNRYPATAPYNFVPLPDEGQVVQAEDEVVRFDSYNGGKLTGHIDLDMESLTPIFTRGKNEHFFEVDGVPVIPGSSVRGMVRHLVEVASYGKFLPNQSFTDSRLYNRSSFDKETNIRAHYRNRMENFSAGFLNYERKTQRYYILPSRKEPDRTDPTNDKSKAFRYFPKPAEGVWEVWSGIIGRNEKKQWVIHAPLSGVARLYLSDEDVEDFRNDKTRKAEKDMKNILEQCKKVARNDGRFPHGLPIFYSQYEGFNGEERIAFGHTRYFRMPYGMTIGDHVPDALRNRSTSPDLAGRIFGFAGDKASDDLQAGRVYVEDATGKAVQNLKIGFPRILSTPKPTSFQLYLDQQPCGIFTNELVLSHWGESDIPIRGYKGYWHIANENAEKGKSWEQATPTISVNALGGMRRAGNLVEKYGEFLSKGFDNYDNFRDVVLKKTYSEYPSALKAELDKIFFPTKKGEKTKVQFQPMAPLPTGSKFSSRIRFENLSEVELGALLFVLDLNGGLAHKLGLGKPIGLGSVRISPKLVLTNREKRYAGLFGENEWHVAEIQQDLAKVNELKDTFAAYIGSGIGKPAIATAAQLWQESRMKDLGRMLQFEQADITPTEWLKRTAYGEIPKIQRNNRGNVPDPFRERWVLPNPEEASDPKTRYHS